MSPAGAAWWQRRWVLAGCGIAVVAAVAAAAAALWACHVLHQTPFMAGPDRISVCGRYFAGPGNVYRLKQLEQEQDAAIGTVVTWQGRREVWGRHLTVFGVPGCGTGVYVRVGRDTFRGYGLLGGP
jgi:hypothetical protein